MRRFLAAILSFALAFQVAPCPSWAAINSAMVWQIDSAGSDTNNSGGFRGGAWIAAPSAPTVTGASTGGTVAAGTYYVAITYTDGLGETVVSGQTSVTVSGATSKFTVTSPVASTGAVTWSAYSGTTTGGPYWPISTGLTIGSDLVRTTTPPTSGTQPRGVDYSLASTRQLVIDNSTVTCTTTGANSNTLTFTLGHTAVGAEVGNTVRIATGTNVNAGDYEITAVTATTWTVTGAQNLTTAGGAGSAITGGMGGCHASLGQSAAFGVAGNFFAVKAGTYAMGNGTANTAGNKVAFGLSNMTLFGYTSNRHPFNTDTPPVFTAGANSQTVLSVNGAAVAVDNIKITNPSTFTNVTGINFAGNNGLRGRYLMVTDCAIALTITSSLVYIEDSYVSGGTIVASGNEHVFDRVVSVSAPSSPAIQLSSNALANDCVVVTPVGSAFDMSSPSKVRNCSIYNSGATTAAITIGSSRIASIENTIIYGVTGSGGKGVSASGGLAGANISLVNVAIGNTSGAAIDPNIVSYQQINCLTLSGNPWVNPGGNDFSLNTTSGAGALCRQAGLPGALPGLSTTGYRSLGAVEPRASTYPRYFAR